MSHTRAGIGRGAMAAAVLWAAAAPAQQREPHAGYIVPAGGCRGATFEMTLGGQYLDGATNLIVSGGDVTAAVLRHIKIPTQQQLNSLRNNIEKFQQLQQMGSTNAARKKEAEELKKRIEQTLWSFGIDEFNLKSLLELRRKYSDPKRQVNPAISEMVRLKVTIAPNAAPGDRELRLQTDLGLTNPMKFQVGVLPERQEKEPNNFGPNVVTINPPLVLNGQIMPGDIDRFRVRARKGERFVVWAQARALIPYLADAVPGWFQATLGLYDADGRELAYCDDNRFDPDPVVSVEIPSDGEYDIEIKDSIYRGREDFVYRIVVGAVPFISGIFPLGGRAGQETPIRLTGWNLPASILPFRPAAPGIYPIAVRAGDVLSNWQPFVADTWPEMMEQEPNNEPARAMKVTAPVVINGRIEPRGDRDLFVFQGSAGVRVVAEVVARRLNSPLDSILRVFDPAGKEIAFNDDHDDKGAGLVTHQADSRVEVTLPADGVYLVSVSDAQNKGGADYAYRLRLGVPRPDFALRVVPSTVNLRAAATVPLTVFALRKDGFDGPIDLVLVSPTNGYTLSGNRIPAGQNSVRMTLTGPAQAPAQPVPMRLEGVATIAGKTVQRPATPADDMMQAFFYRHLVPAESWLAFSPRWLFRTPSVQPVVADAPFRIAPGSTASVQVRIPTFSARPRFHLELNEPPEGLTLAKTNWREGYVELILKADAEKSKAGLSGNLIVEIFAEGGSGGRRRPVGVLPAIPFEVVRP